MSVKKQQKKINVLIVEDSLLIARKLRKILSSLDFVNITGHAKNYNEATAILGIMVPDVVILDIQMPGKSGLELLTEIKLKHLVSKVIIFSNYSDAYYRNLCNHLGANYFLDKSSEFEKIPMILEYYNAK